MTKRQYFSCFSTRRINDNNDVLVSVFRLNVGRFPESGLLVQVPFLNDGC